MAKLYGQTMAEESEQKMLLAEANTYLKQTQEDKKIQALEAARRAKSKKANKKETVDLNEDGINV